MWSGSKASTISAAAIPWRPSKRATRVSSPRSHAHGIKVMGATMTSALGMLNPSEGWNPGYTGGGDNGPVVDANRMILNTYIRTSGLYDGVADFDAATLDPSTGNMKAEYL